MSSPILDLANALLVTGALLGVLVLLLALRSRIFCQYLRELTGIELSPQEVRSTYRRNGREGVRELLLDRTIRADLAETPAVVPPDPR